MNFHELAGKVAAREGGGKRLDIAQVNEVVSLVLSEMKQYLKEHPILGIFAIRKLILKNRR